MNRSQFFLGGAALALGIGGGRLDEDLAGADFGPVILTAMAVEFVADRLLREDPSEMILPRDGERKIAARRVVTVPQVPQRFFGIELVGAEPVFDRFDGGSQPLGIDFGPAIGQELPQEFVFDQLLDALLAAFGAGRFGDVVQQVVESQAVFGDRRAVDGHQDGRRVADRRTLRRRALLRRRGRQAAGDRPEHQAAQNKRARRHAASDSLCVRFLERRDHRTVRAERTTVRYCS